MSNNYLPDRLQELTPGQTITDIWYRFLKRLRDNSVDGIYTPIISNLGNITSAIPAEALWFRTPNIVHVTGNISIAITGGPGACNLGLSLPVPSNFAQKYEACGGCVISDDVASIYLSGRMRADPATGDLFLVFYNTGGATTSTNVRFWIDYLIK